MNLSMDDNNIINTLKNGEECAQQFEDLVYELFKRDQWPTYKEIMGYFEIPSKITEISERTFINELESLIKRRKMCEIFTFAIPSFEMIEIITKYQPILEIGAGSGFWAALLKRNECDIIATTIDSEDHPFFKKFTDIEYLSATDAIKKYPDRTVFCSWPSIDTWAEEALPYIKNRIILISENGYGSTASENFYDTLEKEFELKESYTIPQWNLVNDNAYVYERLKNDK